MSRRMLGLLLLLAMFGAGVAVGIGLERVRPADPARNISLITRVPSLLKSVGLSPAQQRAVDSLINGGAPRALAAMRETVPILRAVADSLDTELRQILTPAQRARFDSLGGFRLLLKRKTRDGEKVDTLAR